MFSTKSVIQDYEKVVHEVLHYLEKNDVERRIFKKVLPVCDI